MDDLAFGDDDADNQALQLFDKAVQSTSSQRSLVQNLGQNSNGISEIDTTSRFPRRHSSEQPYFSSANGNMPHSTAYVHDSAATANVARAAAASIPSPSAAVSSSEPTPSSKRQSSFYLSLLVDAQNNLGAKTGTSADDSEAMPAVPQAVEMLSTMKETELETLLDRKPSAKKEPAATSDTQQQPRSSSMISFPTPTGDPSRESSFYKDLMVAAKERSTYEMMNSSAPNLMGDTSGEIPAPTAVSADPPKPPERQSSFYLSLIAAAKASGQGDSVPAAAPAAPAAPTVQDVISDMGAVTLQDTTNDTSTAANIPPPTSGTERQSSFYLSLFAPPAASDQDPNPLSPPIGGTSDATTAGPVVPVQQRPEITSILNSNESLSAEDIAAIMKATEEENGAAAASLVAAPSPTLVTSNRSLTRDEILALTASNAPPSLSPSRSPTVLTTNRSLTREEIRALTVSSSNPVCVSPPPALNSGQSMTPEEIMAIALSTEETSNNTLAGDTASTSQDSKIDVHLVGQTLDPDHYQEQILILEKIEKERAAKEQAEAMERNCVSESVGGVQSVGNTEMEMGPNETSHNHLLSHDLGAFGGAGSQGDPTDYEDYYKFMAAQQQQQQQQQEQQQIQQQQQQLHQEQYNPPLHDTSPHDIPSTTSTTLPNENSNSTSDALANQELLMRGNRETWTAIANGEAHIVRCLGCRGNMQVARTASLVFCPNCRTVSPAQPSVMPTPTHLSQPPTTRPPISDSSMSRSMQRQEYQAVLPDHGKNCSREELNARAQERLNMKLEKYSTNHRTDRKVEEKLRYYAEEHQRRNNRMLESDRDERWYRQKRLMEERERRRLRKFKEQEKVDGPLGGTVTEVRDEAKSNDGDDDNEDDNDDDGDGDGDGEDFNGNGWVYANK